jgi:hypothetical protein
MTDEELDRARAMEAIKLANGRGWLSVELASNAARLAREGRTPPDPLEAEVEAIFKEFQNHPELGALRWGRLVTRKALERGIEIGRNHDQ